MGPPILNRPAGICSLTRGIPFDFDITPQKTLAKAEDIKKFGPLQVTALDCQTAIVLLNAAEKNVLIESLQSLHKFCKTCAENREIFVSLKGVPAIFSLIEIPHRITQRLAMKLLAMTSYIAGSKVFIRDHDGAQALMNLGLYSDDDVVVEYATAVLGDLAANPTCGMLMVKFNAFEALMDMSWKTDPDIQLNVLIAVRNLMDITFNVELMLKQTSFHRILELTESNHDEVKLYALSIIDKVSRIEKGFELLANPAVVYAAGRKMKKRQGDDVNRLVLRIFHNLSSSIECCLEMLNFYPQLVYFLDYSVDPKILSRTLKLVANMCHDPDIAKIFLDYGLVEKIAKFITHKSVEVNEGAIVSLIRLQKIDPALKNILYQEMIPLIALLNSNEISPYFLDNLLHCFTMILDPIQIHAWPLQDERPIYDFINYGGLKCLRKMMSDHHKHHKYPDSTMINAMTCLNRLIHMPEVTLIVAQEGLLHGLMKCFRTKNNVLFAATCRTLAILIGDEFARTQFMHYKYWRYVLQALKGAEMKPLMALAPLLDILATYEAISFTLVESGIINLITRRHEFMASDCPFHSIVEQFLQFHLPAKYAITGRLDFEDILSNGFYESGRLTDGELFVPLNHLTYGVEPKRKILYLDNENIVNPKFLKKNRSLQVLPGKQEPNQLQVYMDEIQKQLDESPEILNEKQLVRLIGRFVSNKLGGPVKKWRVDSAVENKVMRDLQQEYRSVAVPISMFKEGSHRTRAMLFKTLAENLGVPATLERGEGRSWNMVLLRTTKRRWYQRQPGEWGPDKPYCRQPRPVSPKKEPKEVKEEEKEPEQVAEEEPKEEEPIVEVASSEKKVALPSKPSINLKKGGTSTSRKRNQKSSTSLSVGTESKSVGFADEIFPKSAMKKGGKNTKDKINLDENDENKPNSIEPDGKPGKKNKPKSRTSQEAKGEGKTKNGRGKRVMIKDSNSDNDKPKSETEAENKKTDEKTDDKSKENLDTKADGKQKQGLERKVGLKPKQGKDKLSGDKNSNQDLEQKSDGQLKRNSLEAGDGKRIQFEEPAPPPKEKRDLGHTRISKGEIVTRHLPKVKRFAVSKPGKHPKKASAKSRKPKKSVSLKVPKKTKEKKKVDKKRLKPILKHACKSTSTGSIETTLLYDDDPLLPDCILGQNIELTSPEDEEFFQSEYHGEDGYEADEKFMKGYRKRSVETSEHRKSSEFGPQETVPVPMSVDDEKRSSFPLLFPPIIIADDLREFDPIVVLEERNMHKYWYHEKMRPFVVDLMYEPGEILELHTPEADVYIGNKPLIRSNFKPR